MCLRARIVFVLALLAAVPARAESIEEAWMFKGSSVLVKCTQIDALRGFHDIWVEERSLGGEGQSIVVHYSLLRPKRFARYRRSGELELFRQALNRAMLRLQLRFSKRKWRLTVNQSQAEWPRFSTQLVDHEVRLLAQGAEGTEKFVIWTGARVSKELGFERKADRTLHRVSAVSTAKGADLWAIQMSTKQSIHAQLLQESRVILVSRPALREKLQAKPKKDSPRSI
jgi:hypothetical protein